MAVVGVSQGDGSLPSSAPGHRILFVEEARAEAKHKARGAPAAPVYGGDHLSTRGAASPILYPCFLASREQERNKWVHC